MGNPDTNHELSSTSAGQTFIDNGKVEGETQDQRIPVEGMISPNKAERIAYMAGRADFRAARMCCAQACEEYNNMEEDSSMEERMSKWLNIVDPNKKSRPTAAVGFSEMWKETGTPLPPATTTTINNETAVSHVQPRTPTFPYVKKPIYMDYGLRVRISPTAFINRSCFIMDTPVADIVIGERCSLGPHVSIIGVGHPVAYEERCESETGKPGSWGAKVELREGVWVGACCSILPGVTIGEFSVIAAGSVVTKDIPPRCVAAGNPARIRYSIDGRPSTTGYAKIAWTLEEALKMGRDEGDDVDPVKKII